MSALTIECRDIDKVCEVCGAIAKVELVDDEKGSVGFFCRLHARQRAAKIAEAAGYRSVFDWLKGKR